MPGGLVSRLTFRHYPSTGGSQPRRESAGLANGGSHRLSLPGLARLEGPEPLSKFRRKSCAMGFTRIRRRLRSEEHTSELQSLMRISYAVFCLKKNKRAP